MRKIFQRGGKKKKPRGARIYKFLHLRRFNFFKTAQSSFNDMKDSSPIFIHFKIIASLESHGTRLDFQLIGSPPLAHSPNLLPEAAMRVQFRFIKSCAFRVIWESSPCFQVDKGIRFVSQVLQIDPKIVSADDSILVERFVFKHIVDLLMIVAGIWSSYVDYYPLAVMLGGFARLP